MSTGVRYTATKRRQVEAARQARIAAEMAEEATWTLEQHIAWTWDNMNITAGHVTFAEGQVPVTEYARRRFNALRPV